MKPETDKLLKHPKIVRSEFKTGNVIILILGTIVPIIIGIILMLTSKDTIAGYLMGTLFSGFGIYCGYTFLSLKQLVIAKEELLIYSIWGGLKQTIPLKELKHYTAIKKKTAGGSDLHSGMEWEDLTLVSKTATYNISSSLYSNYSQLKKAVTAGLKKDKKMQTQWDYKISLQWAYIYLIFGLLLSIPIFLGYTQETTGLLFWSLLCLSFISLGIRNIIKYRAKSN